jgi:hypothetical protein
MKDTNTYAKYGYEIDQNNIKNTKINHYFQQKKIVNKSLLTNY